MKTQATSTNSYAANRTVEITVWILGILVLALILFSTNSQASNFQFEDETYIDDIPFDTEMVVHLLMLPEFNFEEEAFVNDMPFNTQVIAMNHNFKLAVKQNYDLPEELYVNDIPFNTCLIAKQATNGKNCDMYACTK